MAAIAKFFDMHMTTVWGLGLSEGTGERKTRSFSSTRSLRTGESLWTYLTFIDVSNSYEVWNACSKLGLALKRDLDILQKSLKDRTNLVNDVNTDVFEVHKHTSQKKCSLLYQWLHFDGGWLWCTSRRN